MRRGRDVRVVVVARVATVGAGARAGAGALVGQTRALARLHTRYLPPLAGLCPAFPPPFDLAAGGASAAFSIASRYGTWQGLAALKQSGGAGVRITDEGLFEAQRGLG